MSWKRNLRYHLRRSLTAVLLLGCVFCFVIAAPAHAQDQPAPGVSAEPVGEADSETPQVSRPTTLFQKLTTGSISWFMLPILAASVLSLWFAIERLLVLRRSAVIPYAFVTRFIEHLEQDRLDQQLAVKLCEENGSPVAHVFEHGVRKWGKPSVEIEQAIIDGGERQIAQLRKHLRILNGVATVAPLLGLLGTVVGMIMAFDQIAGGTAMGKAEQLAGGIGIALLTTAGGLTVAIPSLILYLYLSGRVDILVMEMDALAQKVVGMISAEGIAERQEAARKVRQRSDNTVTAESA